jgi:hypothetical protein
MVKVEIQIVLENGKYIFAIFEPLYFITNGITTVFTYGDIVRIVVDKKNRIEFDCQKTLYTMRIF